MTLATWSQRTSTLAISLNRERVRRDVRRARYAQFEAQIRNMDGRKIPASRPALGVQGCSRPARALLSTARSTTVHPMHVYEVRPRKDHRGFTLISDVLPFGWLWYLEVDDAIGYAQHRSSSHRAVIRVYDDAGNVIATHEHKGDLKEW